MARDLYKREYVIEFEIQIAADIVD